MSETDVLRPTLLLSRGGVRLWRNNNGVLQDKFGNFIQFGLAPGSADCIGFKSILITEEMIGKRIAQFVSIETKSPTGKTNKKRLETQTNWRNMVIEHGGIAGFSRSVEESKALLGVE